SAIRPVAEVNRLLILGGELGAEAVAHTGRRADADIHGGGQAVFIVSGPLAGAVTPAELRPADAVIYPRRPIPRHAPVPFHVAIEGEQFVVGVEGDVVGVAEDAEHDFEVLAVGVAAEDAAAGGHAAGGVAVAVRL